MAAVERAGVRGASTELRRGDRLDRHRADRSCCSSPRRARSRRPRRDCASGASSRSPLRSSRSGRFLTIGGFDTGLKLPEILLRYVPFAANARMPGRAMVGVYMALGVLAALSLWHRHRPPAIAGRVQWLLIAPGRLRILGRADPPDAARSPAVYSALAAAPPGRGLRGAVRHRRRPERRRRIAGARSPCTTRPCTSTRWPAATSAGCRRMPPSATGDIR